MFTSGSAYEVLVPVSFCRPNVNVQVATRRHLDKGVPFLLEGRFEAPPDRMRMNHNDSSTQSEQQNFDVSADSSLIFTNFKTRSQAFISHQDVTRELSCVISEIT